ncbi:MAG: RDD family protein [Acidobacteriia bacterium]|nr:RDD family protein [Terriglobia bacterium]
MKPRFEPDVPADASENLSEILIDPEAYDASEQQFAASLETTASRTRPRFVVEDEPPKTANGKEPEKSLPAVETCGEAPETAMPAAAQAEPEQAQDPDAWRREVAARLSHYRARRRTREPRYPSLQLKFETEPSSDATAELLQPPAAPVVRQTVDYLPSAAAPRITLAEPANYPRIMPAITETTAKVIEFASYNPAPRAHDELAEPVLERPRIMEAPELVPPPPALGGFLIEPVEEPANERRPGFEIPLQAAPMARRIAASAIDATLVMSAFAAFAYIFVRITAELPPLTKIAGSGVLLIALFWSAYQYLLLVYSGATPGLKLARLELHRFDGGPVPLRVRRWRVLTSVLSGLSLGLGYAWCFLDEDRLCWHDRITRTYMAPKNK